MAGFLCDMIKPCLLPIVVFCLPLPSFTGPKNTILRFVVKFFPPDHTQIMEELTQ